MKKEMKRVLKKIVIFVSAAMYVAAQQGYPVYASADTEELILEQSIQPSGGISELGEESSNDAAPELEEEGSNDAAPELEEESSNDAAPELEEESSIDAAPEVQEENSIDEVPIEESKAIEKAEPFAQYMAVGQEEIILLVKGDSVNTGGIWHESGQGHSSHIYINPQMTRVGDSWQIQLSNIDWSLADQFFISINIDGYLNIVSLTAEQEGTIVNIDNHAMGDKLQVNLPYQGSNGKIDGLIIHKRDETGIMRRIYGAHGDTVNNLYLPQGDYIVQVNAMDDQHVYSLYESTQNGQINIDIQDLILINVTHTDSQYNTKIKGGVIMPFNGDDLDLYDYTHFVNAYTSNLKLYTNKYNEAEVMITIGVSGQQFTYGMVIPDTNFNESVKYVNTGVDFTSQLSFESKVLECNKNDYLRFRRDFLIADQYDNAIRWIYLNNISQGDIVIRGSNYENKQELEVNGGIDFVTPATEGVYDFTLDFSDSLPIPVPDVTSKMTVGGTGGPGEPTQPADEEINAFIGRFYEQCLGRVADAGGISFWREKLKAQEYTGAMVAEFFVKSEELANKGLSNEEYIKVMYQSFFNRDADQGGLSFWMDKLSKGITRNYILSEFVNSAEFSALCNDYKIQRGNMVLSEAIDVYPNLTEFTYRFYQKCMDRTPDAGGLTYWVDGLSKQTFTGSGLAEFFVFSDELTGKNLSNDEFVTIMYRVFFDREADQGGKAYWMQVLGGNAARKAVFNDFVYSQEFIGICNLYNIKHH